ncbi:MAG: glycosyltransferase [Bacteroidetes bacterium]|nr:MAG: glycosyltransferase [Bacteroidota bacterium]
MKQKSILFLTTQLPYPPVSGGVIKTYKLLQFFSEEYELHLISLLKNDDENHAEAFLKQITKLFSHYFFPLNKPRSTGNLIKSYFKQMPLNVYRNFSPQLKDEVHKRAEGKDILFIDHFEMFQYVPEHFSGKIIFHEHNAEFLLWQRYAELLPLDTRKIAVQIEANRILKKELQYCRKADLIFAAPNDIKALTEKGADKNKFRPTYHLGNDNLLTLPDIEYEHTKPKLLFLGTLSWEANKKSVIWFLENCWSAILQHKPETTFEIVGKNADEELKNIVNEHSNVFLRGFVENLEEVMQDTRVMISPLVFGSGIKVKNLDALYRGIPLVTTGVGAEGLKLESNENCLIADNSEDFTQKVIMLLEKQPLWEKIKTNSRALARKEYTWHNELHKMKKEMECFFGS